MTNEKKYNSSFTKTFGISDKKLAKLKYQDIKEWDSVGHMNLISSLESKFNIQMEIDDIIDFSSFKKGKTILKKYKIVVK